MPSLLSNKICCFGLILPSNALLTYKQIFSLKIDLSLKVEQKTVLCAIMLVGCRNLVREFLDRQFRST